jgi:Leucine-rich repeat (LRR) protein
MVASKEIRLKVTAIDVSGWSGSRLPDIFAKLPNLKDVSINCHDLRDISVLRKYPIVSLSIGVYRDLKTVSKLKTLERLKIPYINKKTLLRLTRLKSLTITTDLTDPSILYHLPPNLTDLEFKGLSRYEEEKIAVNHSIKSICCSKTSSLRFLSRFPSLTSLTVERRGLTDSAEFNIISTLHCLLDLRINYGLGIVEKEVPISLNIPSLETLTLDNAYITDTKFLKGVPNVTSLSIRNSSFSADAAYDWSPKNVIELTLDRSDVPFEYVMSMKDTLEYLSLSSHESISDITRISECSKLEILKLDRTYITDISPIGSLTKLRHVRPPSKVTKGLHYLFNIEHLMFYRELAVDTYDGVEVGLGFDLNERISGKQLQERLEGVDYIDESVGEFIKPS